MKRLKGYLTAQKIIACKWLASSARYFNSKVSLVSLLSRRQFISLVPSSVLVQISGCRDEDQQPQSISDLQTLLDNVVKDPKIPGVSAALVQGERLLWSGAAGFADLERGIEMTVDHILNIGSISKTITATAVMQQVERGKLNLDRDVNDYLSFSIRNPKFPDIPITTRQLLVHRSSLTDGSAYGQSYACGDPAVELGVWVEAYRKPGGQFYNEGENFLDWAPGADNPPTPPRAYSNVAFGLLGHLVERISGQEFNAYCRAELFDVLRMNDTRWKIGNTSQHALPYTFINKRYKFGKEKSLPNYLFAKSIEESDVIKGTIIPHCLYSFYNYPDGLLRTNPVELASFLRAYIGGGQFGGKRILREETVREMLTEQHEGRGLCWSIGSSPNGGRILQHGGSDPGISTFMGFRDRDGSGAIVFFNCSDAGDHASDIVTSMFSLMNKQEEENTG